MTVSQNSVREHLLQASVGARVGTSTVGYLALTLVNSDPQAVQKDTATLSGAFTVGIAFTLLVLGISTTYTTDGTEASLDEVADALAKLCEANPDIRGQVILTVRGSGGIIDAQGIHPSISYTIASGSANVATASVQAAAPATRIPFGRLMLYNGFSDAKRDPASMLGKLASSAAFSAQVDTQEIEYVAAADYAIKVCVDGVCKVFEVTANTDSATTVGDIITALLADSDLAALGFVPSDGGAGSGTTHILSLTVPAGSDMSVEFSSATAGTFGAFTTNKGVGTSLALAAAGVSERADDEEEYADGDADYPPNAGVDTLQKGPIWVEIDTTEPEPTQGAPVWVELTAGANAGKFYTRPASGRKLVPGLKWLRGPRTGSGDALGALQVSLA